MNAIQSAYTIGIALCLFSSAVLTGKTTRASDAFSYFVAYLTLESLCFLLELLIAHPATPLKALWLGLLMSASFLIAPCLWLAIKESVEGSRPRLSSVGTRERAVIVIGALLTLPLLETVHLGVDFHDPNRVAPPLLEPLIHETMLLCIGLFAVQVPHYLWKSRQLLLASRAHGTASWLHIPLLIVCTTWLLGVVRTLTAALSDAERPVFAVAALADVSVTIACVYFIVKKVAASPSAAATMSPSSIAEASPTAVEAKYAKSQLDDAVRARITRKLRNAFGEEAIHRDAAVSLASLSRHLNENEHYVSQVLNQELGTSFYELVSASRVEHAKRLLLEFPDRNVLDIALAVGFNAKSTFNNAFRRHTGVTPREFRSQRHQEGSG